MRILGSSVHLAGIRPELVLAIMVVDTLYHSYGEELVITSVVDSEHSSKSLHYVGAAFDARTSYFTPAILNSVVNEIRSSLGFDFDVVVEKDHLHVEFQPKYR
jgi:hypothetical protein